MRTIKTIYTWNTGYKFGNDRIFGIIKKHENNIPDGIDGKLLILMDRMWYTCYLAVNRKFPTFDQWLFGIACNEGYVYGFKSDVTFNLGKIDNKFGIIGFDTATMDSKVQNESWTQEQAIKQLMDDTNQFAKTATTKLETLKQDKIAQNIVSIFPLLDIDNKTVVVAEGNSLSKIANPSTKLAVLIKFNYTTIGLINDKCIFLTPDLVKHDVVDNAYIARYIISGNAHKYKQYVERATRLAI